MNTDAILARSINAGIVLTKEDAVVQGYLVKGVNGYHATVGGQQVTGPAVKVRPSTGEVLEDLPA